MNQQMHVSFSGIDYYGTDVGGFWRKYMDKDTLGWGADKPRKEQEDHLFTQWLANSAWFDVPVRIHTYNCGFGPDPKEGCPWRIAPDRIGHMESNRANLQQRYALIPYYYSLAHRAHREGEPVVAPPVMRYQGDLNLRGMGNQKLIGPDLMVGIVANARQQERRLYLPRGQWIHYHTNTWIDSQGQWTDPIPLWLDEITGQPRESGAVFRLPVFVRAGAILPMMAVDNATKDVFGNRQDGARNDTLIVRVYPDGGESHFTLYEDDGVSVNRWETFPHQEYDVRTTEITQRTEGDKIAVEIAQAAGHYKGEVTRRQNEIRLVLKNRQQAIRVTFKGQELPKIANSDDRNDTLQGWYQQGLEVFVRTGIQAIGNRKLVEVHLNPM